MFTQGFEKIANVEAVTASGGGAHKPPAPSVRRIKIGDNAKLPLKVKTFAPSKSSVLRMLKATTTLH